MSEQEQKPQDIASREEGEKADGILEVEGDQSEEHSSLILLC